MIVHGCWRRRAGMRHAMMPPIFARQSSPSMVSPLRSSLLRPTLPRRLTPLPHPCTLAEGDGHHRCRRWPCASRSLPPCRTGTTRTGGPRRGYARSTLVHARSHCCKKRVPFLTYPRGRSTRHRGPQPHQCQRNAGARICS
jgi:hypothetical protein